MTPYYEHGGITIYHGDARDVADGMATESVDLIVTDPPYGINYQSGMRKVAHARIAGDDGSLDVPDVLRVALKTLRNHRHIYVFGPIDLSGLEIGGRAELIWDKGNHPAGGDVTSPWARTHEAIAFGVHVRSAANRRRGDGTTAARLRRGSVLSYPRLNSCANADHPTEKPIGLLRELIEMSSRFGELVLDPFMGVGSTLMAAVLEGRRAVGIEIEERYCEVAAKRLEVALRPGLYSDSLTFDPMRGVVDSHPSPEGDHRKASIQRATDDYTGSCANR